MRANTAAVDAVLCIVAKDPAECGDVFPDGWKQTVYADPKQPMVAVVAMPVTAPRSP
jgi:hypothetical protein